MNIAIQKISKVNLKEAAIVMMKAFNTVNQGWTEEASVEYTRRILKYSCSYIAVDNDKAVGFLAADIREDHVYIDAIGVLPEYMGQGIAKYLFNVALQHAKENKVELLKMTADPTSIAYQWYMKLGFKETGWVELMMKIKKD
jgi:ribosomal protein S18 acetylase RimI-like enzyme